jgi:NAD(P)-dependent dehydrogenase (short-subunit alcohol dehydrogenase family)
MERRDLEGRSAIVTGAAMGIGRASAEALARAGANVVIADRDREQGESAAKALVDAGASAYFVETDVTSLSAMEHLAAETARLFGGIDILVNNAARALGGVVDETDEATWNLTLSTNLSSVWRGMKVCVPHMRKKSKGAIVNMSSVQALTGFKGWAAYAAAKGGVNALTQQAAIDLAPAGIRVNAIAPGTIMTPLNQRIFASHPDPQGLIDSWNRAHPLGRFGEASEVAEAVLFLASDRSSFVTGEILRVDGGLVVRGE